MGQVHELHVDPPGGFVVVEVDGDLQDRQGCGLALVVKMARHMLAELGAEVPSVIHGGQEFNVREDSGLQCAGVGVGGFLLLRVADGDLLHLQGVSSEVLGGGVSLLALPKVVVILL